MIIDTMAVLAYLLGDDVVYNLPVDSTGFQAGQSNQTSKNNIGLNSWGQKNYHRLIYPAQNDLALIEIYALDKKFSTIKNITGAHLERKMTGHVLASGTYQLSFGGN